MINKTIKYDEGIYTQMLEDRKAAERRILAAIEEARGELQAKYGLPDYAIHVSVDTQYLEFMGADCTAKEVASELSVTVKIGV